MSKKFVYLMFYVSLKYTFVIFLEFLCAYFGIDLNFCMNHMLIYHFGPM